MGFNCLFIDCSLLSAHVARRDGANEGSTFPLGECYLQAAVLVGPAQRVKPVLAMTVLCIVREQQGLIEKDLLHFCLGDAMLLVLAGIAFVPIKAGVGHGRPLYMPAIYHVEERLRKPLPSSAFPTLRKIREGWGTRREIILSRCQTRGESDGDV